MRTGGAIVYAAPVFLRALVQMDPAIQAGQEIRLSAIVTLLETPAPNAAPGREGVIDARDRLTVESGPLGPIVRVRTGMTDESTTLPFALQVHVGR